MWFFSVRALPRGPRLSHSGHLAPVLQIVSTLFCTHTFSCKDDLQLRTLTEARNVPRWAPGQWFPEWSSDQKQQQLRTWGEKCRFSGPPSPAESESGESQPPVCLPGLRGDALHADFSSGGGHGAGELPVWPPPAAMSAAEPGPPALSSPTAWGCLWPPLQGRPGHLQQAHWSRRHPSSPGHHRPQEEPRGAGPRPS